MPGKHKHHSRKAHHTAKEHIQTIPELRRAFEHIEKVGNDLCHKAMSDAVPAFQEEWKKTFYRELEKKSAEAYLEHLKKSHKGGPRRKHKTRRLRGGMAPLDYQTRPGIYLAPDQVPPNSYAQVPKYIESGFWNPERSTTYDPVPGQTTFPLATPSGMGTNAYPAAFGVKGGARKTKKLRGGMAALSQAFMRPFSSMVPPSVLQDAQTAFYGEKLGASPDPIDANFKYQMAAGAKPAPSLSVTAIPVDLNKVIS